MEGANLRRETGASSQRASHELADIIASWLGIVERCWLSSNMVDYTFMNIVEYCTTWIDHHTLEHTRSMIYR